MSKKSSLVVDKVSKSIDKQNILKKISFQLQPKQITALIGPNGSGKTTLIKIITGLYHPTQGNVTIAGLNLKDDELAYRSSFGYVPDNPVGFEYLSGREFLTLMAQLKSGKSSFTQVEDLIAGFDLKPILNKPIETYSRGSKQKLAFISAILSEPKLLLIDEPVVGLDDQSITLFGERLQTFAKDGGTVLFTSHILEFAKRYADQALLIHQGKIKKQLKITQRTSLKRHYQKLIKP